LNHPVVEKSDSYEEPLDEKADSRPAIRKCREQSLQATSLEEGTALAMAREALKGETRIILLGESELDDSPPKRDADRMGPITGAELRHKVGDSALDGCFRDK